MPSIGSGRTGVVSWAEPGPQCDYAPTRAAFTTAGVVPIQFTCGLGVPGNLAVGADEFEELRTADVFEQPMATAGQAG